MRKRNFFIKFLAFFCLIIGAIFLFGSIVASFYSWIYFRDSAISKKILLNVFIVTAGVLGFLISVGLFQYLNSFLKLEEEVEKIEEEVREIEQEIEK